MMQPVMTLVAGLGRMLMPMPHPARLMTARAQNRLTRHPLLLSPSRQRNQQKSASVRLMPVLFRLNPCLAIASFAKYPLKTCFRYGVVWIGRLLFPAHLHSLAFCAPRVQHSQTLRHIELQTNPNAWKPLDVFLATCAHVMPPAPPIP